MKKTRKILSLLVAFALIASMFALAACGKSEKEGDKDATVEETTILVAAAASLEKTLTEELIPAFNEEYPEITVDGTYDSSGKLQTQIEEGLDADIFFSAATKQMDALVESGKVEESSVINMLENKIVLIAGKDSNTTIDSFEKIGDADTIALGDPASVPAGQYAQESLTALGVWDSIQSKVSFGTNVTEVLGWVAEGSAQVGIVYKTDALSNDKVKVIATAPEDSLTTPVIYPIGMVKASTKQDAAQLFLDFVKTDTAKKIFEKAGFTILK